MNTKNKLLAGYIVAAHGRQCRVELENGDVLPCLTRGKKSDAVCGDAVFIRSTGADQGVIEEIRPRRTLFYRSNAFRQKLIAANVDQLILVAAVEPAFSTQLLERCLIAAESQNIATLIVLNKCDLINALPAAKARLHPFATRGCAILNLSAHQNADALLPHLHGKTSLLAGQSGMGKSTLINALIPAAEAATREISAALDSGKHTTTHTRLYHLDAKSHLIDSPGLQEFGLAHLTPEELTHAFSEFAPYQGDCRFRDCQHLQEPDCALRNAVENGKIAPERLQLFQTLMAEHARTSG
ncbi:putative ribosome biogenesis GTPase RsgA [Betaproteobacteria bacterium]|nr:putative ribosome biogenesis GTPase RsgA [Betaproteobacteria bacterium]GHU45138.1 putative ribosome biogenesis GTPase RsgA [Betaproteobacteria bacterium]